MSKCIDCRNVTPQHWSRCEVCAFNFCRHLMSGGAVPYHPSSIQHFPKDSRVLVPDRGLGTVKRKKFETYRILLDSGEAIDIDVRELKSA